MFERIVVGLDGSNSSRRALELAVRFAAVASGEVWIVSVIEEAPPYVSARREEERDVADARSYFGEIQRTGLAYARRRGVTADAEIVAGNEARSLIDATRRRNADLLAIGNASHSGVWGTSLGSTAHKIVHAAPVSVLVARETDPQLTDVLVGYDGSASSERALVVAASVVGALGARLVIAAKDVRPAGASRRGIATALARVQQSDLASAPVITTAGDPVRALIRIARAERAQLIVIGATGEDRPWSRDLGSTATSLLERVDVSVLVVRMPTVDALVAQLMRRHVRTVTADTTVRSAAALLLEMGAKTLVVVDSEHRPVGILTLGDLLRRAGSRLRHGVASALTGDEVERQLTTLFRSEVRCDELMTREVVTVPSTARLEDALATMAKRDIKRVPVIDADGKLVGLLSRADMLRALTGEADGHGATTPRVVGARIARDLMRTDVSTVPLDASVEETARTVLRSEIGRVAVIDADGRLQGVIALRDLLPLATGPERAQAIEAIVRPAAPVEPFLSLLRGHPSARTAASIMRRDVFSVGPDATLGEVLDALMTHGIARLLVVDADRRVLGAVDRGDLLRSLAERAEAPPR